MKEPGLRIAVLMYETKNKTKQNLEWNMLVSDSWSSEKMGVML